MDSVQKHNSTGLGPKIQLKWTPGKSVIAQRWRRSLFSAATVRRQPSSCHQLAFHIKYETNTNTRIQKYEIQTQRFHFSPAKVSRQVSSYHELLVSFAFHTKYKYIANTNKNKCINTLTNLAFLLTLYNHSFKLLLISEI